MSRRPAGPCGYCLREITADWARFGRTKFCSNECWRMSKRVGDAVPVLYGACRECQGVIVVNRRRMHCSAICRNAEKARLAKERYWTPTPERTYSCASCAGTFTRSGRHGSPLFCSPACVRQSPAHKASRARMNARRRARRMGQGVLPAERVDLGVVAERDGYVCQLCGVGVVWTAITPHPLAPTLDHIIPLAKGGTHAYANIQLAHFRCNSIKGDRLTVPLFRVLSVSSEWVA